MIATTRSALICFGPVLLLGLVLVSCSGPTAEEKVELEAGPVVREARLGPVGVEVRMNPAEPHFGDRIRLTIDVTWEAGTKVEEADLGARLGHFRVRDRKGPLGEDPQAARYVLEAEAERTGLNIVRLPEIRFRVLEGEGSGDDRILKIEPLEVVIKGLPEGEEPDLASLTSALSPVLLPKPERDTRLFWMITGCVVLLAALGTYLWMHRRGAEGPRAIPIDPVAEARSALERLLARKLTLAGLFGEFYLELTAIVRRFIERTTSIHAPEQTTEEFLRAMGSDPGFPAERRQSLGLFLESADLVKFAAQVPSAGDVDQAISSTRAFCELAESGVATP